MAKAKKSKSTKAGKLPKSVAGIELPKELRKQGAKLLDLIKNPMVGDLVAAGLVALAANVRNQGKTTDDAGDAGKAKDKTTTAEALGKTAATLATVVAARAAEKITSKLAERPAPPPASTAAATAPARAPAKAPAKPAAKPKTTAPAAKTPAKPKPAAPLKAGATRKAPTRKPAARKPAPKPAS